MVISTTEATSGHPTSCLSAADVTTVLFDQYFRYDLSNSLNLYNDRFVLYKGHAGDSGAIDTSFRNSILLIPLHFDHVIYFITNFIFKVYLYKWMV